MSAPLVLASKSAARRALLSAAGLEFEAVGSEVDEAAAKTRVQGEGGDPRRVAEVLAAAKAQAASARRPGALVVGADQTLEFEGALVDKAGDLTEARRRLRALAGRSHQLHSAAAVARDGEILWAEVGSARLVMRPFSDAFLDAYLERNARAALQSVGGYELEGEGVQLFERIDGDYFTILGLPLLPLLAFLRAQGTLAT